MRMALQVKWLASREEAPRQEPSGMQLLWRSMLGWGTSVDERVKPIFRALAAIDRGLPTRPIRSMPENLFQAMHRQLKGAEQVREERDALLLRVAELELCLAAKDHELALLAVPDDLDLVPILIALTEGFKIDPTLSYFKLYRLYVNRKVIGMQEGKGTSISICRNSLKRYLAANRPKVG